MMEEVKKEVLSEEELKQVNGGVDKHIKVLEQS